MKYYNKVYNQFNIIHPCRNREFAMLPKIRGLKIHSIKSLTQVLELIHWDDSKVNLYRSVAKLKNIPFFTFNMRERSKETSPWFTDNFAKEIYSYDLFFDFDKDDDSTLYDVLEEVKDFTSYLDEYEVSYYVLFSGNKGFQVIIDGDYLPPPIIKDNAIQPHKRIQENVLEAFEYKYLDLRNNGVPNRLCKAPYSLCQTEEGGEEIDMNVALPLDENQLINFKIEDMSLRNVENKIRLSKRGIMERNSKIPISEKIKRVSAFIKSIDI